jgi:hypothetical protein
LGSAPPLYPWPVFAFANNSFTPGISMLNYRLYCHDFNWRYLACPNHIRKEVTAMIKKIKQALFLRRPVRADRREFNGELLDQRREDVFVLMHQQMASLY